jgi:hypothetical protein
MTVSEMHQSFRFGLDKLDSLNYPNFLPEEIDLLLNQAQDRYIKQRYGTTNPKRQSFEETQKRTDDLRNLIVDLTLSTSINTYLNIKENSVFAVLPSDYWFLIQERVAVDCDICNEIVYINRDANGNITTDGVLTPQPGRYIEVRPIQHLEFDKTINDAFKAPDYDKVLRLMYNLYVELIPSTNCNIIAYKFRYIRKPNKISLTTPTNCELADHTHQEIIDEAIKIALEGIEAKRTQTFTPIIDNQKE